jgi:hypothetical protein
MLTRAWEKGHFLRGLGKTDASYSEGGNAAALQKMEKVQIACELPGTLGMERGEEERAQGIKGECARLAHSHVLPHAVSKFIKASLECLLVCLV